MAVEVKAVRIEATNHLPFVQDRVDSTEVYFPAAESHTGQGELRRDYEKLRAAYFLTRAMAIQRPDEDLDGLFNKILDAAFEVLDATRGALLVIDQETGKPVPRVARHRRGDDAELVLSSSVIKEVMNTRGGLLIADAARDSRFQNADSIISEAVRSTMCVPLLFEDELLGLIHLDSQFATHVFSEADLDLFSTIARHAADGRKFEIGSGGRTSRDCCPLCGYSKLHVHVGGNGPKGGRWIIERAFYFVGGCTV